MSRIPSDLATEERQKAIPTDNAMPEIRDLNATGRTSRRTSILPFRAKTPSRLAFDKLTRPVSHTQDNIGNSAKSNPDAPVKQ